MLRDMRITGLEVYFYEDGQISPITGNGVMLTVNGQNCYLNLYMGDPENEKDKGEFVYRMPLVALHNMQSASGNFTTEIFDYEDLLVQWEKCSITFSVQPNSGQPQAILINVFYTSRKHRTSKLLQKKISGLEDGSLADVLMVRMMELERKIANLLGRK